MAIVRNHNEVTQLNLCGMVICLLGIFAHVIRKSLKSDAPQPSHHQLNLSSDSSDEEFFRPRAKSSQSPIFPKEGFSLLDDSDSEEYIEMHRNRTKSVNSDDFVLQETRTWTSVRDRHMQGLDAEKEHEINNDEQGPIVHLNLSDD